MPDNLFAAQRLARFAANLRHDQIPVEVTRAAARYLADTLACATAAAADPDAKAIEICWDYALQGSSRPEATILGSADQTDLRAAALVNCTMASYIDANDVYMGRAGHFSDAIPALVATAEKTGARGRDQARAGPDLHPVRNPVRRSPLPRRTET